MKYFTHKRVWRFRKFVFTIYRDRGGPNWYAYVQGSTGHAFLSYSDASIMRLKAQIKADVDSGKLDLSRLNAGTL